MRLSPCFFRSVTCLLLGALCACAPLKSKKADSVTWELSPEAKATYYYLLLEDAKRTQDGDVGKYALDQLLKTEVSPDIYYEAATFYWNQGQPAETRTVLEAGLKKYPDNQELQLLLAEVYLTDKRVDDAFRLIKAYLKKNPADVSIRQKVAEMLLGNEEFAKAFEILSDIPAAKQTPTVSFLLAKALGGMGQRSKAIAQLHKVVNSDPKIVEAWAELAYLYELDKNFAAAEQVYARILKLGESSNELWLRLIDLNLKLRNPAKAFSLAQQGPKDPSFLLGAGTLFVDQGFSDHAERLLLPVLDSNPDAHEIRFYLALLTFKNRKDFTKALSYLDTIPEHSRFHDRALRFKAHLLFDTGQPEEALRLAANGRKLYPGQKDFWTLEASLLEEKKDYARSKDILKEALKQWPDDIDLLFHLGIVSDKSGNKDEAMQLMEGILARNPDHADAMNYVGYSLADANKDLDRAHILIKKALKAKPDNGYIQDSLAWVYYRQGKIELAWEEILRAVTNADKDPIIWEHYGDIAARAGRRDEARKGYTKALQFNPDDKSRIMKKLESL